MSYPAQKHVGCVEALLSSPEVASTPFFSPLAWLSRLHLPRNGFRLATCCTRLLGYPAHKGNTTLLYCKPFTAVFCFSPEQNIPATFLPTVLWPPTSSSAVSIGAQNHCTSKAPSWPDSSSACSPWSLHLLIWSFCSHGRKGCTACAASAHLCSQQTSHAWAVEWLNFKKMCFKEAPKKRTKQTYT